MKKIFTYTVLAALTLLLSGCAKKELDTNPYGDGIRFSALAPNPVMRGGELRILGSNLEQVTEVRFAGGVSVTDIQVVKSGTPGEIRLLVPLEGPEVGPVTIVGKDGVTRKSFADLTFTEPIEVESIAPAQVLSGDILTIKGEYLNDVKMIIFTGTDAMVTEFESQSRHELKVAVPANAITGPVILSDVNEIEDENTIPNHIYSATDLVVGNPTVVKAEKAIYKSGDVIKVEGEHLDMIKRVDLPQASDVKFIRGREADWITFNLPPEATDGNIILTSYADVTFDAGEIETVTVRDLAVKYLAEDQRYKAGTQVEISGTDLDLVSTLSFKNADDTSWYLSEEKIIAIVPADAQDGAITVTLASGKQVFSEDIEVVKPEILGWEHFDEYVAGETVVLVEGLDLDLVTDVTIGDKDHGLIPCEYELVTDELGFTDVNVKLPEQAYTGPITFTSAAGYTTATYPIEITYDMAVDITFDSQSYSMGKSVSLTGKNLLKIEQVYVKGRKVVDYSVHSDDAMAFALPEGVGPGVYRLNLVLTDDTTLTWPVPFEVTAPYTETFYWEGSEDLGNWSNQPYLGGDGALDGNVVVGDIVRIYYTPYADWWQFEVFGGHWDGQLAKVTAENTEPGALYYPIEVTDANIGTLTIPQGWGGIFVVQGESVVITGVSVIHFGATETVVWEGPSANTGDYALNLELGGEDDWVNAEMPEGAEVRIYFTPDDPEDWSIQIFDGHWGSMSYVTPNGVQWNNENSPEAASKGYVSFIAEGNAYTALTTKAWWGFALIVQGKNLVVNQLTFQ